MSGDPCLVRITAGAWDVLRHDAMLTDTCWVRTMLSFMEEASDSLPKRQVNAAASEGHCSARTMSRPRSAGFRRDSPLRCRLPADHDNPFLAVAEFHRLDSFRLPVLRLRILDDFDLRHMGGESLVHLGDAEQGVGGKVLDLFQEIAKRLRHGVPPVAFTNRLGRGEFLEPGA